MNAKPLTPDESAAFGQLMRQVVHFDWRGELEVQQTPSPQRIAPASMAVVADVVVDDQELGSGRLVLLHDPAGVEPWQGRHRLVSLCRAQVDAEMADDPLLAEVAWSWLVEALGAHRAPYAAVSGTVTTVVSRGFGGKAEDPQLAEVEIRASWTPLLDEQHDLTAHLAAWQDLLCTAAGLPAGAAGIATLVGRTRRNDWIE